MTARIGTACQTMGETSKQEQLVFFRISKRAADDLVLNSLDPRVVDLTFILRVDGKFGTFEGEPVENVKFGRVRDYISVDFLIKENDWRGRTVQQIAEVLIARVERTPEVLAAACRKKSMPLEVDLLRKELAEYCRRVRALSDACEPWEEWAPPQSTN